MGDGIDNNLDAGEPEERNIYALKPVALMSFAHQCLRLFQLFYE